MKCHVLPILNQLIGPLIGPLISRITPVGPSARGLIAYYCITSHHHSYEFKTHK